MEKEDIEDYRKTKYRLHLSRPRKSRREFPAKKTALGTTSNLEADLENPEAPVENHEVTVENREVTVGNPEAIMGSEANDSIPNVVPCTPSTSGSVTASAAEDYGSETSDECIMKESSNLMDENIKDVKIEGRRIINVNYFFEALKELDNHCPALSCSLKNMHIYKEIKSGFLSQFSLKCNMCNMTFSIETDKPDNDINEDAVLGTMGIGSGHSHLNQLFSTMDIPSMGKRMYNSTHEKICKVWEEESLESMKGAAEEEKQIAIEAGTVDENGTPLITVVADGSWAKHSYHSNFNSPSGAAAIIGYNTKKVLYIGVRNKYCIICKMAENQNKTASKHRCFKNWTGSSTSMEADIIAEGFCRSLEMYGLIYDKLIADGDSNCYKKILDSHPNPTCKVKKIECKNHLLRNYSKKIRLLVGSKDAGPLVLRKKIQANELRLRFAISKAIFYRKNQNISLNEKISLLKEDIDNFLSHVFDGHKKCKDLGYFCDKPYQSENTAMSDLKLTVLYEKLSSFISYLRRHADSLIFDVDNNVVENLNSVIAKFIGGKRINYCRRGSYQARCAVAVVSHNTKRPLITIKKRLVGYSPMALKRIESRKVYKTKTPKKKLLFRNPETCDENYGLMCKKPDMEEEQFEEEKKRFLTDLIMTKEEIAELEKKTREQSDCDLWYMERRKRLTASRYSAVCKRRATTSCKNLVKSIIYPKEFHAASTSYGKENEKKALTQLEQNLKKRIDPSGLFVDSETFYLAATRDGLIDEQGIVEVKCPYSARYLSPEEAIYQKKITFWNKEGEVNEKHKWFYQIQGQLKVTGRYYCVFCVWTPHGIKHTIILRDSEFWKEKMQQKLESFYMDCLLPELVDPRVPRNMEIRDPIYILNAMKTKNK